MSSNLVSVYIYICHIGADSLRSFNRVDLDFAVVRKLTQIDLFKANKIRAVGQ